MASALWIDVIVWHLFRTVILGKAIHDHYKYHAFCWGVPLLYILLTLTTNDYGVSNGEDNGYCWVVDRNESPSWAVSLWEIVFFCIIWISCLLVVGLIISILRKATPGISLLTPYIQKALKKLLFYPVK